MNGRHSSYYIWTRALFAEEGNERITLHETEQSGAGGEADGADEIALLRIYLADRAGWNLYDDRVKIAPF